MSTAQIKDHIALEQKSFRGLYSRGVSDTVPDSFFSDCLNVKFGEGEVSTRDGSELKVTAANVIRFFTYKRFNETPRLLMLNTSGQLLDSIAPGTPIWTDAAIVDFSIVNYNNRAYITVHNRIKGLASKYLLVYEGSGMARQAAGVAPSGFSLIAQNSVLSGNVEAGIRIVAMAYVTSSGFITAPGPVAFASLTCTGGFKLYVNNIAIGGASVVARVVLASKAIPVTLFNGNQYGYELFFVPDGVINDNTSTDGTFNFFDADLVQSADYLIDNLSQIPAGVGIGIYSNRLCVWGEDANEFTMRLSEPGQPEVFSSISGFITVDPSDSESGLKNAFEQRKSLVLATSNRFYSTSDNGSDPNTWDVQVVDKSSGTECFGVSTVLDARGTNSDRVFIATRSGVISYEGYVKRPELTFNIEDYWKRINKAKFNLVQIVDDPENHRLIISLPLDAASAISHLLLGDYSKAFTIYGTIDEKMIKWSPWTFPAVPMSIMGDVDSVTKTPVLYYAVNGGNVYSMKPGLTNDYGNAIDSFIKTSLKQAVSGWINHFGWLKLRVIGSGSLTISMTGEDNANPLTAPSLTLSSTPGSQPDRLINYINEKMSVKFRVSNINEKFTLSNLLVYSKNLWLRRATS